MPASQRPALAQASRPHVVVPYVFVAAFAILGHLPALQVVDFHYDDGHSLVRNPHVRELSLLPQFFVTPSLFSEKPADAMYRPLVLVAHTLNQRLSPDNPAGFVALNLVLHALVAVLLFDVLRALLPVRSALAGASLFALHPLQSEVVSYASARSESIAAAGILLSVTAFLRYRHDRRAIWLAILAAGHIVALGAKEVGVVTPLLLLATYYLKPAHKSASLRPALYMSGLIVFVYLIVYQSVKTLPSGYDLRPMVAQLATQTKALVHYMRAVVMPVDLSVAPQFRQSESLAEISVLLSGLMLISVAVLSWIWRHRAAQAGVGMLWWMICLLPTLIVPLNVLVNDHRPYLAMGGLILSLAMLLSPTLGQVTRASGARALLAAAGVILVLLCWQRGQQWHSEISLWQSAVRTGPQVAAAHHNLAVAHHTQGHTEAATRHYELAIELKPDYVRPLTNLGILYRDAGRLNEAERLLRRAMQADPRVPEAPNNLGLVYMAQDRPDRAISAYQAALQADATIGDIWYNIGLAQRDLGQTQQAMQSLQRALQLDPSIRQRLGPRPR